MSRNVVQWPNVEEQHPVFNIGKAIYTAIPVKADLPDLKISGANCLVTVLSAQRGDLEAEKWLDRCEQAFRDLGEDFWTVGFLDGLIISSDWHPSPVLKAEITRRTAWHAIIPGLDLPVSMSSTLVKILSSSLTRSRMARTRCQRTCSVRCIIYMMTSKAHLWCLSGQYPRITGMFNDLYFYDMNNYYRPFEPLGIVGSVPHSLSVAVPSRIFSNPSRVSPLLGVRIGVKDLFDIAGLHMTLSNRAFYAVSAPAQTTAPAIQKLLDAGAVMGGTTKCSSMISREDPTEAVDFQAPYNPRGDGYQSPVGSSSGSAAAIASYDWLDFTIGSDSKVIPLHCAQR